MGWVGCWLGGKISKKVCKSQCWGMDGIVQLTRTLNGSLFWGGHCDLGIFWVVKFVIGQSN